VIEERVISYVGDNTILGEALGVFQKNVRNEDHYPQMCTRFSSK
jgi:hypothetical protein